jgi:hypothetical protein
LSECIYRKKVFKTSKGNQKMQFQVQQLSWPIQKGQEDNGRPNITQKIKLKIDQHEPG